VDEQPANKILSALYERLLDRYGPQHWWPADSPFEVIVGAILTQSAAWTNVEKAIVNLKMAGVLSPEKIRQTFLPKLAGLIYSCGYYNAKAKKLQAFCNWFGEEYGDNLTQFSASDTDILRKQLLGVYGIGEETADSILLYTAGKPVFVIDAYTRRIIDRIGCFQTGKSYSDYQELFMENLPVETRLFNEYHALLVALGKDACRRSPLCSRCCARNLCLLSGKRLNTL
jgi:endonuclease III related protein